MPADKPSKISLGQAADLSRPASRAEKLLAFQTAMRQGARVTEAARTFGISEKTAFTWNKKLREKEAAEAAIAARLLSRAEVAAVLVSVIRGDDPELKVKASMAYSRLMGLEAPQRAELTVKQVPQSVGAWLESRLLASTLEGERQPIDSADSEDGGKPLLTGLSGDLHLPN